MAQGDRLGIIASSDNHLGKAGAYSQGLAVVLAPELMREAIFDAFWNRRTYAVTGDRIRLGFHLNWYYVRVTQSNRQFAWSSPNWVEGR